MELDLSHLVTFLIGTAAGVAGEYFATKYTEQRHKKEASRKEQQDFQEIQSLMPKLLHEMVADVKGDKTGVTREFVVLSRRSVTLEGSKPRFVYYENEHENLQNKVDAIKDRSFIEDVGTADARICKMSERLVVLLRKQRENI